MLLINMYLHNCWHMLLNGCSENQDTNAGRGKQQPEKRSNAHTSSPPVRLRSSLHVLSYERLVGVVSFCSSAATFWRIVPTADGLPVLRPIPSPAPNPMSRARIPTRIGTQRRIPLVPEVDVVVVLP